MASKRIARLNEQLKREIASLLHAEVRDPRIGPVSVTRVDIAADLAVARVLVQLIGSEVERTESLAGLQAAAPFLRRSVGRGLHVRRVPELRFQEDRSLEHAQRIEHLLSEVLPDDAQSDDVDPEDDAGEGDG
jgi:ribosome-binding factor A